MQHRATTLLIVLIVISLRAAICTATDYAFTDLGTLPNGSDYSMAWSINSYGQITGSSDYSVASPYAHAFLWTPAIPNGISGSMIDLGDLNGGSNGSGGRGINDFGQVVGSSGTGHDHAFLWTPSSPNALTGSFMDLNASQSASDDAWATAINNFGQVLYKSSLHGAYLWSPTSTNGVNGTLSPLGVVTASAINSSGQITGDNHNQTYLWTPTTANGSTGSTTYLPAWYGLDINDRSQITGWSEDLKGFHGYLWTPEIPDDVTFVGGVVDDTNTYGEAINNLGQITGSSEGRAFVWDQTNGIQDLNSFLSASERVEWLLIEAHDINDFGQIIGYGDYDPDGPGGVAAVTRAFLLTPVPEPSTIATMMGSVIFLIGVRKPRK